MPDLRRIACAILLALGPASGAAQDCAPRLTLSDTSDRIAAVFSAPCAPYTSVTVTHGPLVFGEQTGRTGDLRLDLPALGGGVLSVALGGTVTRAPLPAPAGPVPPLAALRWTDAAPPDMLGGPQPSRRLGFPGEAPQIDLLPGMPDHIDLAVTPATCGRSIAAQVITGDTIRDLRVTLPGCDGPSGALRIPLAP